MVSLVVSPLEFQISTFCHFSSLSKNGIAITVSHNYCLGTAKPAVINFFDLSHSECEIIKTMAGYYSVGTAIPP